MFVNTKEFHRLLHSVINYLHERSRSSWISDSWEESWRCPSRRNLVVKRGKKHRSCFFSSSLGMIPPRSFPPKLRHLKTNIDNGISSFILLNRWANVPCTIWQPVLMAGFYDFKYHTSILNHPQGNIYGITLHICSFVAEGFTMSSANSPLFKLTFCLSTTHSSRRCYTARLRRGGLHAFLFIFTFRSGLPTGKNDLHLPPCLHHLV